jgi:DNA-binding response OmpR family regulator
MNKQKVYTVNSLNLYNILEEIKDYLNFNIEFIDLSKFSRNDFQNNDFQSSLFLVFEKDKFKADKVLDLKNVIYLQDSPISLSKLVEKINIFSLKFNFKSQSKIKVNDYVVDTNERKIIKNNNELKLTEREIEIILFLDKKETPQNVDSLQTQIWKQKKELETHTVETHIYRLRKKINEKFNDNNFIKSNEVGYFI